MSDPTPNPCREFRHAVPVFTDGELSPERILALEAHRDACPPCAEFLRIEREFRALLADNLGPAEPPAGFDERLRSKLKRERVRGWLRVGGLALAASLALATGGWGALRARAARATPQFAGIPAHPAGALPVSAKLENGAVLRGELICINCRLWEKYGLGDNCAKSGHRGALLLSDGRIIYFSDETPEPLRAPPGAGVGAQIEVHGDYAPGEQFIRVADYRLLKS